jgi:hypothetical protein
MANDYVAWSLGGDRRRRRPALLLPPLCSLFVIDELKVVRER